MIVFKFLMCFSLIFGIFAMPLLSYGETAVIENNVSVSSSSGGNSASKGEVIEGKSSSKVEIKTTVNDEVVTDISEEFEGNNRVEVTNSVNDKDVETKVEVNSTTSDQITNRNNTLDENKIEETEKSEESFISLISRLIKYVFKIF